MTFKLTSNKTSSYTATLAISGFKPPLTGTIDFLGNGNLGSNVIKFWTLQTP